MPTKGPKRSFFDLTPSERDAEVRKSDRRQSMDKLRPMSARNKLLWEAAQRRRGRPRLGTGAVKVLVTLDPTLLEQADRYAKLQHLKRSQLISRALKNEMKRAS